MQLILTCEHYSAHIPRRWARYFIDGHEALHSHRGWDIGVPSIYRAMRPLAVEAFHGTSSRLLVDLNRSETHPGCFSEFSRRLPKDARQEIIETIHRPFRRKVFDAVATIIAKGQQVLHVSVHTFTPQLDGEIRNADIGLLYDPARAAEKHFADCWSCPLSAIGRVRRNYPYRGSADGHTTALRRAFSERFYLGIELEVNQSLAIKHTIPHAVSGSLEPFAGRDIDLWRPGSSGGQW